MLKEKQNIVTTKSDSLHERRNNAVPEGPYNITQLYVGSAKGAIITDVDGNELIDFAGGIGMQNVGHCHPKVVQAIQSQVASSIHSCFHVAPYESYIELAERLNELTPGDFKKKTMFANSGAEAVENAVKIARKATGRSAVVSFERAYHGRTLLTMSLTSKVKPYKHGFGPFASDVYKLPYPYYYRAEDGMKKEEVDGQILAYFERFMLEEVASDNIAAIILEPLQGEGGFIVPSATFIQGVRNLCDKYGIIMIADEIQTGFARTGILFAMDHFGVVPDLMTFSKSIAAGMPLSAVTGRAELMDAPGPGQLGGTFSGSPVACAAALAVLDVIEEEQLVKRAGVIGSRMMEVFHSWKEKYELIGDVRGLGAMTAIELVKDRNTKEPATEEVKAIMQETHNKGVITISAGIYGNVLRFLPPLVITDEQLEEGLHILETAIAKLSK
ncbi:4-aminobutyrate--2-oxoglutarate transaminase [Bacillus pseudomycoides]|uniref:(S)-3-amino-2-methylpropionate transaminase n=1 Tax=Bacillus pseudomycoides TaxID=64104 RepID=A0A2A8BYQ6_9BACI|nr:4-aminobutyrate--2-oxoglutarate transaminase [Bacillus pseudomycoides]PDY44629.1 4-aminobutyrate--2-oxoglutarate transaminase [Bacillus pseudomycoides]PEA82359.1 4-aminobutyrate--2-oxoglutarate transaminase [Bacillus pseudomycoides]PED71335.1 4-aminobutyrate--2-oxoglutarate transaminase [Bacillus pseudomycoides]PEI40574.1 4-aminobutyrate--2-oxoglutarate transaminase [Bacillus pseudomycoides]PEJ80002.1 4-aminobutyrate--2-oxoglutarate transaminase [Bacillus pseudomycoides]